MERKVFVRPGEVQRTSLGECFERYLRAGFNVEVDVTGELPVPSEFRCPGTVSLQRGPAPVSRIPPGVTRVRAMLVPPPTPGPSAVPTGGWCLRFVLTSIEFQAHHALVPTEEDADAL